MELITYNIVSIFEEGDAICFKKAKAIPFCLLMVKILEISKINCSLLKLSTQFFKVGNMQEKR
jgi:S-adenosylmethionine:tRNA-ribosyltransferase-isomerase (queuine synthetase)